MKQNQIQTAKAPFAINLLSLRKLFLSILTAILFMFTGVHVYADNNDKPAIRAMFTGAQVSNNDKLENMLTEALKLNKEKTARMIDSHKVIKAFKNAGIINKNTDSNIDYQHNYIAKKPIKFMGHNLVVLQEEYMEEYVGCCVNDGIELLLKANGNTQNLQKFATTNECTFTQPVNIQEVIQEDDLPKLKPTAGNYVSLSCKANSIKKNTPLA